MLFDHFRTEPDEDLRWVIGLVLGEIVRHKRYFSRLRPLLMEKKYGHSRSEFVTCYARLGKQDVVPDLISFLSERDLLHNAIFELGRLKAKEAKPHLEKLLDHEEKFFRDLVKRALKKIG